jgi:hypothetical protein
MLHQHHVGHDTFDEISVLTVDPMVKVVDSRLPDNLCIAGDVGGFAKILEYEKNILLHFWSPSATLKEVLVDARLEELPSYSRTVLGSDIAGLHLRESHPLLAHVLKELDPTLVAFASLLPGRLLRIEFLKTLDRSCPLFHVDRVKLRLLCTLRGAGTEWIANDKVNRNQLGHGNNRRILKDDAIVYEVDPFQICILKGEAFPRNRANGIVHRSPAVQDQVQGRWFLRADFL